MPLSPNINAYEDVRPYFEQALDAPNGVRVQFDRPQRVTSVIQRLHKLRALRREESIKLFEPGDPLFGTSPWDGLECVRDPDDKAALLIRPTVPAVVQPL